MSVTTWTRYSVTPRKGSRRVVTVPNGDILTHVRKIYGRDITMPWLPGAAGRSVRIRRGLKVVATVTRMDGE